MHCIIFMSHISQEHKREGASNCLGLLQNSCCLSGLLFCSSKINHKIRIVLLFWTAKQIKTPSLCSSIQKVQFRGMGRFVSQKLIKLIIVGELMKV